MAVGRLRGALVVALATLAGLAYQHSPHQIRLATAALNRVAVVSDSYTTGTDEGGLGRNAWTTRAWQSLSSQGLPVSADVAAEGRAGYSATGDHGHVFRELTARAVHSDDALVVFFGSRNDRDADLAELGRMASDTFNLAHDIAPSAVLLVIGPAWPTADVPLPVLLGRDVLGAQARAAGAVFVDPLAEGWFVGRPELIGGDGVHPTDAGHAYLADMITPLIAAQLAQQV